MCQVTKVSLRKLQPLLAFLQGELPQFYGARWHSWLELSWEHPFMDMNPNLANVRFGVIASQRNQIELLRSLGRSFVPFEQCSQWSRLKDNQA